MALPEYTMRQLLEAGAHFGHRSQRWNPKMAPYIFGTRSDIHIIDLTQTVPLLHQALVALRDVASGGGRILNPTRCCYSPWSPKKARTSLRTTTPTRSR